VTTQLDTVRVNDPGGYEYWFQWAEGENGGGIWLLCDSTRGLRPAGAAEVALAAEVERLREERGALLKELTQSQIDHRETELLLIEAHRQLTLCEASRDRLRRALDAAMQYVNPKDHAWIDGLAGVSE
jgi:hypothetical protein